jgi:hypothetical protein
MEAMQKVLYRECRGGEAELTTEGEEVSELWGREHV